jgi:glucose 1-dehydrogenase
MMELKDQVAIITGAGTGIGFEIALQFCNQGAAVMLNDMDETIAAKAAQLITENGGRCIYLSGDAADPVFVQKMVDKTVETFGKVTIGVANAGMTLFGNFFDYTQEAVMRVLGLNIGGSFFLAQSIAKAIKKQNSGGSLLFMSSVNAHQANKNLAVYAASKAGIEMLAKNLVIELSEFGISVNAIAPGATLTERTRVELKDYEGTWGKITPMKRPAYVQDIANAALFFVSPKSRHITGQTLVIDGGWTAVSPPPLES